MGQLLLGLGILAGASILMYNVIRLAVRAALRQHKMEMSKD